MSALRTGVIGVGHLGYHHARIYAALEGVQLIGIVDSEPARAAKAAADFGTTVYDSLTALIDAGVDAVSVVVPTTDHFDVTLPLLRAGVDVLVEKPIAGSIESATQMVAVARDCGRILQVGHIERFNGAVEALSRAIDRPRFIECHRLSPYPGRGSDVSVVLDLMIHDLDIALALDGSPVTTVDAIGVPVFSASEDIANARVRFASGCVANITCSRVSVERMRKIRVFSTDAYVSTDYSAQEVMVYRKKPGPLPAGAAPMEHILVDALPVERDEPLRRELVSFVDCVRTRQEPAVPGEAGLEALHLAQQIVHLIREST